MKKFKNQCLKGVAVMSMLACTNFVYASSPMPEVTVYQAQISENQVVLTLSTQNISKEVVALEISIVADDIQDIVSVSSNLTGAYTTSQLTKMTAGKEKLTYYIVSEDPQVALDFKEDSLEDIIFTLKTNGKLSVDKDSVSIKTIVKDYQVQNYTNLDVTYTETPYDEPQLPDINDANPPNRPTPDDDEDVITNNSGNSGNSGATNEIVKDEGADEVLKEDVVDFIDLKNHWARQAIMNMANKGIIKGYEDGTFRPNASITRGEFATLLARAFEISSNISTNPFQDVKAGKWYTESVLALYEAGITSGRTDGTFGISSPITNEEISTMLYRTLNVLEINLSESIGNKISFTDSTEISNYAKEAVEALVQWGIINGKPDGTFGPQASTSRAQVAVMLERIFTRMIQ